MKINERDYKLEFTGYTLVLFKQEFHKDFFNSIIDLEKGIDTVSLMEMVWALAKTYDKSIPNFEEFARSITNIQELISKESVIEITESIKKCATGTVEKKV